MKEVIKATGLSLVGSLIITWMIFVTQYSNDMFMKKAIVFSASIIIYVITISCLKVDKIVYIAIFMCFFNIPIKSYYTTSSNTIIIISTLIIIIKLSIDHKFSIFLDNFKRSSIRLPIILIFIAYTVSFIFIKKGINDHLMMYHSVACSIILMVMVLSVVNTKSDLLAISYVLIAVLTINLLYSACYIFYPKIDYIRVDIFSLPIFDGEEMSRLQGLSFRGEAYAEYLMVCGLWIFGVVIDEKLKWGKLPLSLLGAGTVVALILTQSRGAFLVFLVGIMVILLYRKISFARKLVSLATVLTVLAASLLLVETTSSETTLIERFNEFSDTNQYVGDIPATRYYTWTPALRHAQKNYFMGSGPSLAPYTEENTFVDVVKDKASGDILIWPHNITLIILTTVGIFGLCCYLFLLYRVIRLRKVFMSVNSGIIKSFYSSCLICFLMFLFEAQKFDGVLRRPETTFYFISIVIALMFTSENLVRERESLNDFSRELFDLTSNKSGVRS